MQVPSMRSGSLAGAKYEVYAAEDIFTADMQKDADGNRTKYYSEGELVATLVTGDDGKAVLKNLPLGKYKVVEVEAPCGYVLNQDAQYVTFAYVNDHTPVIYETATFTNDRQKLSLSVEKKDSETDEPIGGAVFGLYSDEDIRNVDGKVIIEAGTLLETAVSDENGIVSFTKDYPFAKYYAKEMETPAGYVTNEEVIVFDAQYQGQDIKVAKYSSVFLNTPTTFEFSKEDITSGAELSGATLCVIDKDGNIIELINTEQNKEMLANMPHREFKDLSVIYRMVVKIDGEGIASTPVHNGLADTLGFTEEQLFKLAAENTKRLLPPVVKSMNDVMREIFMKDGMPPEIADMMLGEMPPEQQMYVISNNKGINGAVSMLYEDGLHDLAEKLGSDLYIMPSSIHEVIAVSTDLGNPNELAAMVAEINMDQVALDERLSNQVYHYDKDLRKVTLATDTPNKRLDGIVAEAPMVYEAGKTR